MSTFVLTNENADLPIRVLVDQAKQLGHVQVCDEQGNILGQFSSPVDQSTEDRWYKEAIKAVLDDREQLDLRSQRRGGLTTKELCERVGIPYHGDD